MKLAPIPTDEADPLADLSALNILDTPRDVGFCAHAILEPEAMVIPNAAEDPRFADNPFVTGDFRLRFYAGVPLRVPQGKAIGALCLVDTQPHEFSAMQLGRLKKFSALVEAEMQR
jgi:GAF domain-containing protein